MKQSRFTDEQIIGFLKKAGGEAIQHEVGADKPCAASYKKGHNENRMPKVITNG